MPSKFAAPRTRYGHRTIILPVTEADDNLHLVYSIARGNGTVLHGSGCNLNPIAKWASTVGHFWTTDFGKYDSGNDSKGTCLSYVHFRGAG